MHNTRDIRFGPERARLWEGLGASKRCPPRRLSASSAARDAVRISLPVGHVLATSSACHPRASGDPSCPTRWTLEYWVPAFAGTTRLRATREWRYSLAIHYA